MRCRLLMTFATLLSVFACTFSSAQNRGISNTEVALQKLIQSQAMRHGEVAFMAIDMDNGQVIADHNLNKSMVPASVQKLVTTSAALSLLGSDYQFKTSIGHDGDFAQSKLIGNLIIKASGDPTLDSKYFEDRPSIIKVISDLLAEMSITEIEGDIIVQTGLVEKHPTPRKWLWEDMGNYFGASPSALCWRDNSYTITLRSGQIGAEVMMDKLQTASSGFVIDSELRAADGGGDNAWFFGAPGSNQYYAKGTIPAHQQAFSVRSSMPNPAEAFAKALKAELSKTLKVKGDAQVQHAPTTGAFHELKVHSSPPLAEIVKVCNAQSVNLFAEQILIAMDVATDGKSIDGGLAAVSKFLDNAKINNEGYRSYDGSGLSPVNRLTAEGIVKLLNHNFRSGFKQPFLNSLSVAGQSGTLKTFLDGTSAAGNVMAKSGSMEGVLNYAGYAKTSNGHTIAFCLMVNDYRGKQSFIKARAEQIVNSLVENQ